MSKAWIIGLVILSAVMTIATAALAIMLYRQQRFVPANGNSPYIMFDTKTAQACWSGPPSATETASTAPSTKNGFDWSQLTPVGPSKPCTDDPFKEYGGHRLDCPQNPPNLPFCKDLK